MVSQSSAVRSPAVRHAKSTPKLSHANGNIKGSLPNAQLKNYAAVDDIQDQVTEVIKPGILHAFAIALALSVHSVFEGLAFGLQESIHDVCEHLISASCVFCMYIYVCVFIYVYVCVLLCIIYVTGFTKTVLMAQEMKSDLLLIIKPTLLHYLKIPST